MHPAFQLRAVGVVESPYGSTAEIPKGVGATHTAEGTLVIFPEFAEGLQDIEGFSHL